jgi:uncharacterized protein (DUF1501 family)
MTNRRAFLKSTGVAMFGIGAAPGWLARAAGGTSRNKVLVAVFQRGAADGLNIVVPYGEARYVELRPTIAVPRAEVLDLDGFFGLHPQLQPLLGLYKEKQLAIVHASGSPDPTRSHFDAQDYMESGTPGRKSTADGWLNRALARRRDASPVRAVSVTGNVARTLRGSQPAVAVSNLRDFQVRDQAAATEFMKTYTGAQDARLREAGRETFEALKTIQDVRLKGGDRANGAIYPRSRLGQSLQQVAQLIRADVGLEVAFAEMGGWDHHVNEKPQLDNQLREFGQALAAFHRDLGDRMQDVAVVTMSEFGRTAKENGTGGTDHGHANAMFLMGGAVKGGRVAGVWPGLKAEQLYEGRDLAVTTDFREVISELVRQHLGLRDTAALFPGFQPQSPPGIF